MLSLASLTENCAHLQLTNSLAHYGKGVRGGIPLCLPWFGPHTDDASKPTHGFDKTGGPDGLQEGPLGIKGEVDLVYRDVPIEQRLSGQPALQIRGA